MKSAVYFWGKPVIVTALIAVCLAVSCQPATIYVVITATPVPTELAISPATATPDGIIPPPATPTATPPLPTPNTAATEAKFAKKIFATLTASVPTRVITATPTRTRVPRDISIIGLAEDEERTVKDAVDLLWYCERPMYDYVRTHIDTVTRGNKLSDANAYVAAGRPIVYLPESSSLNDPRRYSDALRTFVAAVALVHEARHIELGSASTEPDAYRLTLPLFENKRCVPNDIGTVTITQYNYEVGEDVYVSGSYEDMPKSYCSFYILHSYTKWRASLPYPQEPPASARPPSIPWKCLFN